MWPGMWAYGIARGLGRGRLKGIVGFVHGEYAARKQPLSHDAPQRLVSVEQTMDK